MKQSGYPRKVVERAINRQEKKSLNVNVEETSMVKARIPFVDGTSQEVRRIIRTAGVKCAFYMPNTTRGLYSVKDSLPPGYSTNVVYAIKYKTCDQEYVGETKRAVKV